MFRKEHDVEIIKKGQEKLSLIYKLENSTQRESISKEDKELLEKVLCSPEGAEDKPKNMADLIDRIDNKGEFDDFELKWIAAVDSIYQELYAQEAKKLLLQSDFLTQEMTV